MAARSSTDALTGDVNTEEDPSGSHSPEKDRPNTFSHHEMDAISSTDPWDVNTEDGPCGRRSPPWVRPNMSELRIVLLGRSGELKIKVGNIILGRKVLSVKDQCERAEGLVNKRPVALINTPELLDPKLPDKKLFYQIERCVTLSAPGPHALLLVLESSTFTTEDRKRLKRILGFFSDESFKYSVALVTEKSKGVFNIKDSIYSTISKSPVHKVVEKCSQKCHTLNNTEEINYTQVTKLMEQIEQMVEENGGRFLRCEMFKEPESAALGAIEGSLMGTEQKMERKQNPQARPREQQQMGKGEQVAEGDRLNLMLFGSSVCGKTSAGNAILGQRESCVDPSSSSVCERREGEVCGRLVTVVEMPALCESQLSASTVSRLCASLCGPGVHAFLMVIPSAHLTDEDKAEITKIQEIFGSRVTDYMMPFFTHESTTAQPVLDMNEDTRELLEICSNRFCVFNNQDIVNNPIVPKLLEAIEEMNRARESCFSLDMYLEAQLEKVRELEARHKIELEEKDRKIRELEQNIKGTSLGVECKDQNSDYVRIVLVGKTGSGKSATGNTILQREEFRSEPSSMSVTTRCKKSIGEVAGRRVAVVDTPGLFDTSLMNDQVQQEMAKCISFLAPGPHVFLIVLQIGRLTKEEKDTLQLIKSTFGKNAEMFTIVIFTRGDDLNESIEKYIQKGGPTIQNLIQDCGNRFHVFNNKDKSNHTQVSELLDKIDMMMKKNGGGYYTNELFQEAELTIKKECERILREKEEEMQREKEVHEKKEKRDEEEKKEKQKLKWKREMDKIEKEKSRMKEEWKRREDEEKNRVEREEKERQEMIEKLIRERKEFEEKQAEEKKKSDREKQERTNREKRERREWEQTMKDAEKEKKEIQEDMKKRAEEWEQERKMEQIKKEEEEKRRKQKEEQERREWGEKQKKMRDEFEKEREQERQREKERRDKEEIMERDLEEMKRQLKKQEEEWDKERNAEREKRYKEDEQRREEERKKIRKLQEEFERERESENQKRKKDDQARREKEEKEHKEMEEDYKRKMEEMKRKYEEDARKQAEEFNDFKEKYNRDFLALSLKHDNELIRLKEEHQKQTALETALYKFNEKSLKEKMEQLHEKQQEEIDELKAKCERSCVIL